MTDILSLTIFHICYQNDWNEAQDAGEYIVESLETEGFIHCSREKQIQEVANKYYHGQKDLILLHIEISQVASRVCWEDVEGVIFPHIYGPINLDSVTNIETFESADVYVYNRWGEEVLKVIGYQNDWEGVSGTDQLPDGTYYYLIEFDDSDKVYKGALTVLRNK